MSLLQFARVGVLYNLELVVLVLGEVLVEGVRGEADGLSDERREADAHGAHAPHVVGVDGPEAGQGLLGGPLVGAEEVVVARVRGGGGAGPLGGQVDLLAVVGGAGGYLGGEAGVAQERGGVFHLNLESWFMSVDRSSIRRRKNCKSIEQV